MMTDDHDDNSDNDDSNDDSVQGPEAGRPADQGQQTRDILPVITVLCCYPHLGPLYTQREIYLFHCILVFILYCFMAFCM